MYEANLNSILYSFFFLFFFHSAVGCDIISIRFQIARVFRSYVVSDLLILFTVWNCQGFFCFFSFAFRFLSFFFFHYVLLPESTRVCVCVCSMLVCVREWVNISGKKNKKLMLWANRFGFIWIVKIFSPSNKWSNYVLYMNMNINLAIFFSSLPWFIWDFSWKNYNFMANFSRFLMCVKLNF